MAGKSKRPRCLIKNVTEKRLCLKIKILPIYAYPGKGSEGMMGFTMKEKQVLTREYAPHCQQVKKQGQQGFVPLPPSTV
jgi:hypothetical protein